MHLYVTLLLLNVHLAFSEREPKPIHVCLRFASMYFERRYICSLWLLTAE